MSKHDLKQKAINFRRQGKTYSEILKEIPVAKSTLSLWLRDVGLSIAQKQNITEKRQQAQKRGADAQRNKRIKKQTSIVETAQAEIGKMSLRELWLVGIALHQLLGRRPGVGGGWVGRGPPSPSTSATWKPQRRRSSWMLPTRRPE